MIKIDDMIAKCSPNGVEFKELGIIGFFYRGLTGKTESDFIEGNAKYITYMNVFSNISVDLMGFKLVKIKKNEKQNQVEVGDVLFTGSSETVEECGMSSVLTQQVDEPIYLNSFCFGYRLHNKQIFLPGFLKYLFRDVEIRKEIVKTANGVTRFNISKKSFAKIKIPIPPLEIQHEIVRTLDKFYTLVSDSSVGLTAEIAARRQQYEYYRNKLLTFQEAA